MYAEILGYVTMPKTQLATEHSRGDVVSSVLSMIPLWLHILGIPRDQGAHSKACIITCKEPVRGALV